MVEPPPPAHWHNRTGWGGSVWLGGEQCGGQLGLGVGKLGVQNSGVQTRSSLEPTFSGLGFEAEGFGDFYSLGHIMEF